MSQNFECKTFSESNVHQKLLYIEEDLHALLSHSCPVGLKLPAKLGRSGPVVGIKQMPTKPCLSQVPGQMRLVHDLAHIEMQAMELGLRTLVEFPDTPLEFKEQLAELVLDEARHLKSLIQHLENHQYRWGDFPVHLSLWQSVSAEDTLIDRLLIVHRYLEGAGLDAGDKIIKRLWGMGQKDLHEKVKVIVDEEVGHVKFGSDWFSHFCRQQNIDPDQYFKKRMPELYKSLPKRSMRLNHGARKQAGFTEVELEVLESLI